MVACAKGRGGVEGGGAGRSSRPQPRGKASAGCAGPRTGASEQNDLDANSGSPGDALWDSKHITPQPRSPHLSVGID